MQVRFDGKVAIVTGSSSGIGKATALRLAAEGAAVCVVANRNVGGGEATVREIREQEGQAIFVQADVGHDEDCRRVADAALARFGAVHVLINNAGITRGAAFDQMTESLWDELFSTNLKGCFLMSRSVIGDMLERGSGSIVNVASVHGIATYAGHAAYAATKAGMCGLTRGLAVEYGARGIRCNCVMPGTIDLGLFGRRGEASDRESWQPRESQVQPLGRLGDPCEVAAAIAFAASDEASFVNGATIVVDGGLTSILRDH